MDRDAVKKLVYEALSSNESLFLVRLSFLSNNKIMIIVDGDQGISIGQCTRLSKFIQLNLDQEEKTFELEVTSPDVSQPLTVKRQYPKNLNRILKVKTADKAFEGTLTNVDEDKITLRWKTREPKAIGKGKVTIEKEIKIAYDDIKEAKVKITF